MKKLLLLFVLFALPASAQETYSLSATAGQVADLVIIVSAANAGTCEGFGLADSCTQAQACVAAGATGGASCTAAQARNASARIFPATQAGREEFVAFQMVAPQFKILKADVAGFDYSKLCQFWSTANTAQKNAVCSAASRPNGCELCR